MLVAILSILCFTELPPRQARQAMPARLPNLYSLAHGTHVTWDMGCHGAVVLQTVQYNLLPDGDSVPVTASNRLLYVYLLADWHLNARLGRAASAFASESYTAVCWVTV